MKTIKALKERAVWIVILLLSITAFISNDSDMLHLMTATFLICCQLDNIKNDVADEVKKNI